METIFPSFQKFEELRLSDLVGLSQAASFKEKGPADEGESNGEPNKAAPIRLRITTAGRSLISWILGIFFRHE